jgi:hypothetical protein
MSDPSADLRTLGLEAMPDSRALDLEVMPDLRLGLAA